MVHLQVAQMNFTCVIAKAHRWTVLLGCGMHEEKGWEIYDEERQLDVLSNCKYLIHATFY